MSTEKETRTDPVVSEVSAAMADAQGLRERVRVLVMRALAQRQRGDTENHTESHTEIRAEIRAVARLALSGMGEGMGQRGVQTGEALREAVHGLDEAVARSVYALRMALDEAGSQGRQFAETDLRATAEQLAGLESDLLATLKEGADKSQGWVKDSFDALHGHLSKNGTDTGMQVKDTLDALHNRLAGAAHGVGGALREQATEGRSRLFAVASGVLHGLADTLDASLDASRK